MARELTSNAVALIVTAVGVSAILESGATLFKSSHVNNEILFVIQVVGDLRTTLYGHPDASYATTANVVAGGGVPKSRISGTTITSPWGPITIASANVLSTANDVFTWSYPATMPLRDCKALVGGLAQYATTVKVNTTVVKAHGKFVLKQPRGQGRRFG